MRDDDLHTATVTRRLKDVARRERRAIDTAFAEPPDRPLLDDLRDPRFIRATVVGVTA